MNVVCDASLFFCDFHPDGNLFTTPSVVGELRDLSSKCRLDVLISGGLRISEPDPSNVEVVDRASLQSGDGTVLSSTDRDVLALALTIGGSVCTDDFALQNVALHLGIRVVPIRQRKAKKRTWELVCTGCGKKAGHPGTCPVCGHELKRTLK